jgi:hypothetical protein
LVKLNGEWPRPSLIAWSEDLAGDIGRSGGLLLWVSSIMSYITISFLTTQKGMLVTMRQGAGAGGKTTCPLEPKGPTRGFLASRSLVCILVGERSERDANYTPATNSTDDT